MGNKDSGSAGRGGRGGASSQATQNRQAAVSVAEEWRDVASPDTSGI